MRGLSVQEIGVLLEMQPDCQVLVREKISLDKEYWEVEITPPNRPTVTVAAQRGGTRTWRDFGRMLKFLRDVCPDEKIIIVAFAKDEKILGLQVQL